MLKDRDKGLILKLLINWRRGNKKGNPVLYICNYITYL